MTEIIRTTYIRTEEIILVNDGQTSTPQPRIYRKRTEFYSRTEARSKVLTFLKIMLYIIREWLRFLA